MSIRRLAPLRRWRSPPSPAARTPGAKPTTIVQAAGQRRPGARGILALRHQRRHPTQPGGGRYGILLRGHPDHPAPEHPRGLLRPQGRGGVHPDGEARHVSLAGRLDGGERERCCVVSPDGRRLRTETLRYDNASNTISTNMHFTFDRGGEHLEGNSFQLRSRLPERRDRPASRRGRRRHAAAGAGPVIAARAFAGATLAALLWAGSAAAQVTPPAKPKPPAAKPRAATPAPAAKPAAPAPVPALHLPDRQRRPAGRGERDAHRARTTSPAATSG